MKRFLGILIGVFAFSACDDGDLVVDSIDFEEVTTSSCADNNLIFKLKESEALILNIPEETFVNDPTPVGVPTELIINETNQVVYSFYNGKVTAGNICDLIPPATPVINKQWKAASGIIQITTTAVKKLNETDNSSRITGYNNSIVFVNIKFDKGDGTNQFYETFVFGDYLKPVTALPFAFQDLLNRCTASGQVYKFNESESFTLDIDPELLENAVTSTPRIGTIGAVKNKLVYRLYKGGVLPPEYFCQSTDPIFPVVSQEWLGKIGGTIEVTTTTNGPNTFKHTIVLKNVTLESKNSNFQLGDNYKYGELQTQP